MIKNTKKKYWDKFNVEKLFNIKDKNENEESNMDDNYI